MCENQMMRSLRASVLALVAAGLLTISCGGIVDPSKNQMESFDGTVTPQGFSSHPFKTDRTGEISIKLTALAPLNNVPLGIIWAQADSNGNCVSVIQSSVANLNLPAISGQIFSGNYCVLVYDLGILTAPETYTVVVSHP
jgi:hypothetical protein